MKEVRGSVLDYLGYVVIMSLVGVGLLFSLRYTWLLDWEDLGQVGEGLARRFSRS